MRILVTGGAGFIGSHAVDALRQRGDIVTIFDNFSSGQRSFLAHHISDPNVTCKEGDIRDTNAVSRAVQESQADIVMHLAANADIARGAADTALDMSVNTQGTLNLLESMRQASVNQIAFASTSAIYGQATVRPTPEDYSPLRPRSLYGASKLAAEAYLSAFSESFGFKVWIFRFANIVGPHATHGILFDFLQQLRRDQRTLHMYSDGTPQKNYLHVADCISGMLFAIGHTRQAFNVFNLASQGQTTVEEIADLTIKGLQLNNVAITRGSQPEGWPGDVSQMALSTQHLERLDWQARLNSTAAVKQAIDDLKAEYAFVPSSSIS